MNDKEIAQIGTCVIYLQGLLGKIQIVSQRRNAPLAFGFTEQALLELVQNKDGKKTGSLLRRFHRGANGLKAYLKTARGKDNLPELEDAACFIAIIKYVRQAKASGAMDIQPGTHVDYLFQQIGENIDNLVGQIIDEANDIPVAIKMIDDYLATV